MGAATGTGFFLGPGFLRGGFAAGAGSTAGGGVVTSRADSTARPLPLERKETSASVPNVSSVSTMMIWPLPGREGASVLRLLRGFVAGFVEISTSLPTSEAASWAVRFRRAFPCFRVLGGGITVPSIGISIVEGLAS